jgi:hypothetical protein
MRRKEPASLFDWVRKHKTVYIEVISGNNMTYRIRLVKTALISFMVEADWRSIPFTGEPPQHPDKCVSFYHDNGLVIRIANSNWIKVNKE